MNVFNNSNDQELFKDLMELMLKNKNKKIMLAYKHGHAKMGAMFIPPKLTLPSKPIGFKNDSEIMFLIEKSIEEKFDMIIIYKNVEMPTNEKELQKYAKDIDVHIFNYFSPDNNLTLEDVLKRGFKKRGI